MTKRPPADPTPANRQDIEQAIEALTEAELVRLQKIAVFRHRSLGLRAAGRNEVDLLSDAYIAVLEGRRKWFKDRVDFMGFIKGVMRSLASHIRDGKAVDAFDDLAPNPVNEEDEDAEDFVEQIPNPAPVDAEKQLLADELDKQIRERFKDDPVELLVYEGFLDKMRPAEIQAGLEITVKEYDAAAKRLRRAVREMAKGGPR